MDPNGNTTKTETTTTVSTATAKTAEPLFSLMGPAPTDPQSVPQYAPQASVAPAPAAAPLAQMSQQRQYAAVVPAAPLGAVAPAPQYVIGTTPETTVLIRELTYELRASRKLSSRAIDAAIITTSVAAGVGIGLTVYHFATRPAPMS